MTLCCQPLPTTGRRTGLPRPRRVAGQRPQSAAPVALCPSTSAGCLSAHPSTTARSPPWRKRRSARPHPPRSLQAEARAKSPRGATESSPRIPTSVTRMKSRWSCTRARRMTSRNSSYAATITTPFLSESLNAAGYRPRIVPIGPVAIITNNKCVREACQSYRSQKCILGKTFFVFFFFCSVYNNYI